MRMIRIMIMMTVTLVVLTHLVGASTEAVVTGKFTIKNSPPELVLDISKSGQTYVTYVHVKDANTVRDIRKIALDISGSSHITLVREDGRWNVSGDDGRVTKIVEVNRSLCSETWAFHVKLKEGSWKVVAEVYDGETLVVKDRTIVVTSPLPNPLSLVLQMLSGLGIKIFGITT